MPTGVVVSGEMRPGMKLAFSNNTSAEVKSIEMHHMPREEAKPGDCIGFNVDLSAKELSRGMVVGDADNNPPKVCKSFVAQVIVLDHPANIHKG